MKGVAHGQQRSQTEMENVLAGMPVQAIVVVVTVCVEINPNTVWVRTAIWNMELVLPTKR